MCAHVLCVVCGMVLTISNVDQSQNAKFSVVEVNKKRRIYSVCNLPPRPVIPIDQHEEIEKETSHRGYTTLSDGSPVAIIGIPNPRSGLCNTNCSCLLALK